MNEKGKKLDRYDALSKEATKSLMQNRLKPTEVEIELEKELEKNKKLEKKNKIENSIENSIENKEVSNMKDFIKENSKGLKEEQYIRPSAKRLSQQGISLNEKEREDRRRSLEKEPVFVQNKRPTPNRKPPQNRPQRQAVDPFTKRSPHKSKKSPVILYIVAGASFLFLAFFLFLLVSFFSLRNEVRYLEETIYDLEPERLAQLENQVSYLMYQNEELTAYNETLHNIIDNLEFNYNIAVPYYQVYYSQNGDYSPYVPTYVGTGNVTTGGPTTHIVESGQSLSSIAALHFGSSSQIYIDAIMEANEMTNPNVLALNQELIIPNSPTE